MPRNQAKRLDFSDTRRQLDVHTELLRRGEDTMKVSYVKRNGQESSSTGTVAFFNGRPGFDTGSVTIADREKGNRTINLHRIIAIE